MMTRRRRAALLASLPLLAGCFTVATVPVPSTAPARDEVEVRGVVVREPGGGEETVEFGEVLEATWTPTSLSIVGTPLGADPVSGTTTQLFPISTMAGLRVRQLDAGRTSALIGGLLVVTAAILASVVSGTAGY